MCIPSARGDSEPCIYSFLYFYLKIYVLRTFFYAQRVPVRVSVGALVAVVLDETTDTGGEWVICVYVIVLVVILLGLYAALFIYQRFFSKKVAGKRACRYCGHMVNVISECHRAPVLSGFPKMLCSVCKQPCVSLCSTCKRRIA